MLFRRNKTHWGEKKLEKYWDNYEAEEKYRLIQYRIDINGKLNGDMSWLGSGDKEWARRISKHYGIAITDPVFEGDEDD